MNSRTLILLRHAKSSWNSGASSDFERPLNERGVRDAPLMAGRLKTSLEAGQVTINRIVSSPAARAIATARVFASELNLSKALITETEDIYEASAADLREVISQLNDDWQNVILTGHNPGISDVCNWLCHSANISMPTCAIAHLTLPLDSWSEVYTNGADLTDYDYPKKQQ